MAGPPKTGLIFNPKLVPRPGGAPGPAPPATASPGAPAAPRCRHRLRRPGQQDLLRLLGRRRGELHLRPANQQVPAVSGRQRPQRRQRRTLRGSQHRRHEGARQPGRQLTRDRRRRLRRGDRPAQLGQSVHGKWNRPCLGDQTTLVDDAGQPIELAAGNTWINLLPNDQGLRSSSSAYGTLNCFGRYTAPGPPDGRRIVRVGDPAAVQRQAPAPDTRVQPVPQRLQRPDLAVQLLPPQQRYPLPVGCVGRPVLRQLGQRVPHIRPGSPPNAGRR